MVDGRHPLDHQIQPGTEAVGSGVELVVENAQMTVAAADAAAVVHFAAVGHAVAAGAGGVVAPAHAARVNFLAAVRDSIAAHTCVVTPALVAAIIHFAAVGHAVAACTR